MLWHTVSAYETIKKLNTNPKNGLDSSEAKKRLLKFGKNALNKEKKKSFFKKLLNQFSDFMVITLVAAAAISLITSFLADESDYMDALIILGIVIINASIGILQESKAEKEIESLKKLATPLAKVLRGGKIRKIPTENVVPGDILILNTGDFICADARILEASNFSAEESSMTGESFAAFKDANLSLAEATAIADRKNMVFAGSVADSGHAKAAVTSTGIRTEAGKVAAMAGTENISQTPLQKRLSATGKIMGIFIMIISLAVFILGAAQHADLLEMFMISISLAVAAIPEGLPAVVTIVLAGGVKKMARSNTIVRRLPAVETLGHASVICSDKTGTLTLNKMTVTEIKSAFKTEDLKGDFSKGILTLGALCNNSNVCKNRGEFAADGEPTENALVLCAAKQGLNIKSLKQIYPRTDEISFDSKRKLMTTIHKHKNEYKVITKGAPEKLLPICSSYLSESGEKPLTPDIIQKIKNSNKEMTKRALRVLAVAYSNTAEKPEKALCENNLTFCGLIGIMDPPRPEAKKAVSDCKAAGIKPVMITGDHPETAKAIAKELGIISNEREILTGAEIELLNEKELAEKTKNHCVFARVSPEHKVRIVKAFKANGNVVAMTGDGVNDAPALKIADIGCAMGKTGTDAAKSASDMIITDDNFVSVVEAVRQGRGMFDNIKKTVHFLISTNIGEVAVVLLGFLMRLPTPLLAIHLLWINLVTDAFPALALGMDPIDKNIMHRPPLSPKKSLFANGLGYSIVVEGCFIAAIGLLSYSIGRAFFDLDPLNPVVGRTMAFMTLGISQLIHAFNVQSRKSLLVTGIFCNLKLIWSVVFCIFLQMIVVTIPSLTKFFKTQPLNFLQWIVVWMLALSPLIASEIEKFIAFKSVKVQKF